MIHFEHDNSYSTTILSANSWQEAIDQFQDEMSARYEIDYTIKAAWLLESNRAIQLVY
jgi:mannitol/fructose-specific phosphotransferase system IIA component (Ntr-type)